MAKLDATERARLPNTAFAYVDSKGNRRLPINDEAHVRAALSRFNQVRFESEEARERAFRRLLTAALEHGIAPVGFVASQMRRARSGASADLPEGSVTLLLTDIEGSTRLLDSLGDGYGPLLEEIRGLIRAEVERLGGYEVDARADEFFAVFSEPAAALECAVGMQREIGDREWPAPVRVRIGLHTGRPARTDTGYVGMPVHVASRVCSAGHGGQILLSGAARAGVGGAGPSEISLRSLGEHRLHGIPHVVELFQVLAPGLGETFAPLRLAGPG